MFDGSMQEELYYNVLNFAGKNRKFAYAPFTPYRLVNVGMFLCLAFGCEVGIATLLMVARISCVMSFVVGMSIELVGFVLALFVPLVVSEI